MKFRFSFPIVIIFLITAALEGKAEVIEHRYQTAPAMIKVACVGNSVTWGYGLENREKNCYPAQLQALLGESYIVGNFGVNGATLLLKGHHPYIQTAAFRQAIDFTPDILIVDLGLNDTDPRDWPNYGDEFVSDYVCLIKSFLNGSNNKMQVFLCRLTPVFNSHPRFLSGTRDWFWQVQNEIDLVARCTDSRIIDLHSRLYSRPDLFHDSLHPDAEGAGIIAMTVFQAIIGDFGGMKIADILQSHMVFQRDDKIPVWGTADRDEKIIIEFAGMKHSVITDEYGNWKTEFLPMKAGGPYEIMVSGGNGERVRLEDIWTGELWICSGQSNMAFPLSHSENAESMINESGRDNLRFLNLKGIATTENNPWDSTDLSKTNRLKFFEGKWAISGRESSAGFSAIGFHFGSLISDELNVPVGIIELAEGGAPAEAFIDRRTLEFNPLLVNILTDWRKNDMIMDWCRERASTNLAFSSNPLQRHPYEPCYIFEAGIQKLVNLPVKGIIWYQGESNTHNPELYKTIFPALVDSWRGAWKNPEMPFYFAQLSSLNRPSWSWFRDCQRQMSEQISNCKMVVTSDLGDSLNVHPLKKREVAERFAWLALKNLYYRKMTAESPEIIKASYRKKEIILTFRTDGNLKTSDGKKIREIEAIDINHLIYPLNGEIKGNKVILQNKNKLMPESIRYGWKSFSRGNLVSDSGLPVSTFKIGILKKDRYAEY